jgi:hypothetical protein
MLLYTLYTRFDYSSCFYGVYADILKIIHGVIKGNWTPAAITDLNGLGVLVELRRGIVSSTKMFKLNLITFRSRLLKLLPSAI